MGVAETVVILAAGQGTRMRTGGPKVLQPLCGRPMLAYVVDRALGLEPDRVLVVVGAGAEQVEASLADHPAADRLTFILQEEQRGTGHAVQCCLPHLAGGMGDSPQSGGDRRRPVVVLYGDMPCLRQESLEALCAAYEAAGEQAGGVLMTARTDTPRGFGRVVRAGGPSDRSGPLAEIVEERDAGAEVLAIDEVNLGVYAFEPGLLAECLPRLSADNAQGELYLTDVGAMAVEAGRTMGIHVLEDMSESIGVNTLQHLAEARRAVQARILEQHMAAGVYIEDPDSTWIDHGVEIGAGSRILPCSVIRGGVTVGAGCEVGPFTHLRPGTRLADGAEVGNFTECKNAALGERTKAKHLSYLGDVEVGSRANIGAGTIVANYDGKQKHKTSIGDRAFVGSGSILIAPTQVGEGALTGAGAVVRRNTKIGDGESWVGVPARALPPAPKSDDADASP